MRIGFPVWFGVVALVFATDLAAAEFGSKGGPEFYSLSLPPPVAATTANAVSR